MKARIWNWSMHLFLVVLREPPWGHWRWENNFFILQKPNVINFGQLLFLLNSNTISDNGVRCRRGSQECRCSSVRYDAYCLRPMEEWIFNNSVSGIWQMSLWWTPYVLQTALSEKLYIIKGGCGAGRYFWLNVLLVLHFYSDDYRSMQHHMALIDRTCSFI